MSDSICVIGAGIVGLSAALILTRQGHSVTLIDGKAIAKRPKADPARVYALNAASQSLLQDLDVWPQKTAAPYLTMKVWDSQSKADLAFDCRDLGKAALGHIVAEAELKKSLIKQVTNDDKIALIDKTRVESLQDHEDGALLSLSNGSKLDTPMAIIADGPNSPMRHHLNVPLRRWSYDQHAFIATVQCEQPHQQCARQIFASDGILAFLPLADPHQCAIVWSRQQGHAAALKGLTEEAWGNTLTKAFQQQLGQVTLLSPPLEYPLTMRHVSQYHGKHWLLMGDAAHTIHPMAGLGLNLGLADVRCWQQLIDKYPYRLCSPRLLGEYQRQRKASVWPVICLLESLKRLFNTSEPGLTWVRSTGLNWVNQSPWLKRQIISRAMTV